MNYVETIRSYTPSNEQEVNDCLAISEYIAHHPKTILTRENRIAHFTSSGFIMNETLDKVLMVHHNIYKTWTWTGGHADGNGNLLEVAIQEAIEETGVCSVTALTDDPVSVDIIPVYGHVKRGEYISTHLHLNVSYVLIADENQGLKVKPDENSGVKWVPVSKLETYSKEPYLIEIYQKIIEKAKSTKRFKKLV